MKLHKYVLNNGLKKKWFLNNHAEILVWNDINNITPTNYQAISLKWDNINSFTHHAKYNPPVTHVQFTSDEKIIAYTEETITNRDDALRVAIYSTTEKKEVNQSFTPSFIIPKMQPHNLVSISKHEQFIVLPENQLVQYYEGKVQLWDLNNFTAKVLPKINAAFSASLENGDSVENSHMVLLRNSTVAIYTKLAIHILDLSNDEYLQKINQHGISDGKFIESFCLKSGNLLQVNQFEPVKKRVKYTLSLLQFPIFKAGNTLRNTVENSANTTTSSLNNSSCIDDRFRTIPS